MEIGEKTHLKQNTIQNPSSIMQETLDLRVDDTVEREEILNPENAVWTEEKTEDYRDRSLFNNVSPIGEKGVNRDLKKQRKEEEDEIKEEDGEEEEEEVEEEDFEDNNNDDDDDEESIPYKHKNPVIERNTDTFHVSATGDSKIESFVLVNSSYDTMKIIKNVKRNLINDTLMAEEQEKLDQDNEDLGVDFTLVSPRKNDENEDKINQELEEISNSKVENSKIEEEKSPESLRESLERERIKIESAKKKSAETKKITESYLRINNDLEAKIKRNEDSEKETGGFTVCFLRRTPNSISKEKQSDIEEKEKEEEFKTSEFSYQIPNRKKPLDVPIPPPSKKKKDNIRCDTGSSSINQKKGNLEKSKEKNSKEENIPMLNKGEISPHVKSSIKKKTKIDGFIDSLEKTFIDRGKKVEPIENDIPDIDNLKKKFDQERKRVLGDINRKLIEDLKKKRNCG